MNSGRTKSATVRARVLSSVKVMSEQILLRMGLSMSEAVELFLRRVIVDQRLPFEVIAAQNFMISVSGTRPKGDPLTGESTIRSTLLREAVRSKKLRYRPKKESKKFFGARTPSQIRTKSKAKEGRNS